jgi:hypothetical protein
MQTTIQPASVQQALRFAFNMSYRDIGDLCGVDNTTALRSWKAERANDVKWSDRPESEQWEAFNVAVALVEASPALRAKYNL